jgi:vacuolar-type H+-ATPase subunit C/Vma6
LIRRGQFSYHNSRVTTIGNPYILRDELHSLLAAQSVDALSKAVTGDLAIRPGSVTLKDLDGDLTSSFHSFLDQLRKETPGSVEPMLVPFVRRYEADELKRVLRNIGRLNEVMHPIGSLSEDMVRQLLSSRDMQSAKEVLETHPSYPYLAEVLKGDELDLEALDRALDEYGIAGFESPKGLPLGARRGAREFYEALCDRYNLNLVLRSLGSTRDRDRTLEELIGRGGALGRSTLESMVDASSRREAISYLSGTYAEAYFKEVSDTRKGPDLEMALDRFLLGAANVISQRHWTSVGPTVRFMVGKEMELRNLRTLFISKAAGWTEERTRSLLILEDNI